MGLIPAAGEEKFRCPDMLSLVSFAGMTLNKCAVLRIGTLTGVPLYRKSPPVQVKEPYSSLHDYLYAFILQNRCIQCTPAYNPLERVKQYVQKKKKKKKGTCYQPPESGQL